LAPLLLYHLPPKGSALKMVIKHLHTTQLAGMADRKKHEELVVITKTYDLIRWSCNHTGKFPRNHRFVLGERIERNLYDLLEILIRTKYTRNRLELLEQANLMLEILRFPMRLAKDLQCLKFESYGFAAKAMDEIGKLVGGWLKSNLKV
jgi:hypothetical protein